MEDTDDRGILCDSDADRGGVDGLEVVMEEAMKRVGVAVIKELVIEALKQPDELYVTVNDEYAINAGLVVAAWLKDFIE